MQQIKGQSKIRMLEPMALFHIYSAFLMSEMEYRCFDPVINRQHLNECLNSLVDEYDTQEGVQTEGSSESENETRGRPVFEAIYLLHNLLNETSINRFGRLPLTVAQNPVTKHAFQLALAFHTSRFRPVLKSISSLPAFLMMAIYPHIITIQVRYMTILRSALASSTPSNSVPFTYLVRVLCPFLQGPLVGPKIAPNAASHITTLCQHFDAQVDKGNVWFRKGKNKLEPAPEIIRSIKPKLWFQLSRRIEKLEVTDLFSTAADIHASEEPEKSDI